jgi:hypothetical protein
MLIAFPQNKALKKKIIMAKLTKFVRSKSWLFVRPGFLKKEREKGTLIAFPQNNNEKIRAKRNLPQFVHSKSWSFFV